MASTSLRLILVMPLLLARAEFFAIYTVVTSLLVAKLGALPTTTIAGFPSTYIAEAVPNWRVASEVTLAGMAISPTLRLIKVAWLIFSKESGRWTFRFLLNVALVISALL